MSASLARVGVGGFVFSKLALHRGNTPSSCDKGIKRKREWFLGSFCRILRRDGVCGVALGSFFDFSGMAASEVGTFGAIAVGRSGLGSFCRFIGMAEEQLWDSGASLVRQPLGSFCNFISRDPFRPGGTRVVAGGGKVDRRADRDGAIADSKLASVERRLGDGDVVVGKPAD